VLLPVTCLHPLFAPVFPCSPASPRSHARLRPFHCAALLACLIGISMRSAADWSVLLSACKSGIRRPSPGPDRIGRWRQPPASAVFLLERAGKPVAARTVVQPRGPAIGMRLASRRRAMANTQCFEGVYGTSVWLWTAHLYEYRYMRTGKRRWFAIVRFTVYRGRKLRPPTARSEERMQCQISRCSRVDRCEKPRDPL
jgi:hypothetical protein